MKVLRESHFPGGKFTLTFVGYEAESEAAAIELTHNWETSSYNVGDGYGHVAIGTDDINATCKRVKDLGFVVAREPGPMQHGTTVIAFVQDPTGYKVELIEKKA